MIIPELGEGVSRENCSGGLPTRSCCSFCRGEDWAPDGDEPSRKSKKACPSSLFKSNPWFGSFESSNTEILGSKYGDSIVISPCWLRKLRRGSHWTSFSKCFPSNPWGHCRKCRLQKKYESQHQWLSNTSKNPSTNNVQQCWYYYRLLSDRTNSIVIGFLVSLILFKQLQVHLKCYYKKYKNKN